MSNCEQEQPGKDFSRDEKPTTETLISFESGHYKKVVGWWKGDSVWCHIKKKKGGMVHINKDKVEYMESF
jgi:hypothetical protein